MLTSDDRREIQLWITDRLKSIENAFKLEQSLPEGHRRPTDKTVATQAAFLACGKFGITDDADKAIVAQIARDRASILPYTPAAMIGSFPFSFSREDLLDIAFWAERTDGYSASLVQVSAFIRAVVRGNLAELRKDRVPAPVKKKLVIKRRTP